MSSFDLGDNGVVEGCIIKCFTWIDRMDKMVLSRWRFV
jgi:hypothetical protein